MKRKFLSAGTGVVVVAAVMCALLLNRKPQRFQTQFMDVFDTISMVISYTKTEHQFNTEYTKVHDELVTDHKLFDIYNDYTGQGNLKSANSPTDEASGADSTDQLLHNLKMVNDNAGVQPVKVDQRIIDLLKWGKTVYTLTDGKVNIAYGAVLSIWHDHREIGMADPSKGTVPDMAELQEAAKHTNIDDVVIDEAAGTVFLRDPEMRLDVGGIAKGYSADDAAAMYINMKEKSTLLNLGGNIRSIGRRADGTAWVCPVESPTYRDSGTGEPYALTTGLHDMSLVTSGDYERYYTVDGVRYHHIIDPDTLFPSTYHRSVTILTENSALADALSTALFSMSEEDGRVLLDKIRSGEAQLELPFAEDEGSSTGTSADGDIGGIPVDAMWIDADGNMTMTDGFRAYVTG